MMDSFPCLDDLFLVLVKWPNIYTHGAIQNQIHKQMKLKSKYGKKPAYIISREKNNSPFYTYSIYLCNSFIMVFVIQQ